VEKAHEVTEVWFERARLVLTVDGHTYSVALSDCSKKLLGASAEARKRFVISPSGYGIHWPDLDEDLSVDRLVGEAKEPRPSKSRQRSGVRPHHLS
jgi:hypothetical protein